MTKILGDWTHWVSPIYKSQHYSLNSPDFISVVVTQRVCDSRWNFTAELLPYDSESCYATFGFKDTKEEAMMAAEEGIVKLLHSFMVPLENWRQSMIG